MSNDLTTQEEAFIHNLVFENMRPRQAAEEAGYGASYGYALSRRLKKAILSATDDFLAFNAPRAANRLAESVDADMPNPVHVSASKEILDRVGLARKDNSPTTTVKANIFILPEKRVSLLDLVPEKSD